MNPIQAPVVETQDGVVYADAASTAPTTPDEGLSPSLLLGADLAAGLERVCLKKTARPPIQDQCRPVRNICCVGAGYVGGPTAAVIALQNPQVRVTVVDKNAQRIQRWNSKHLPIYEPGLYDIVRIARDGSRETRFANNPVIADGEQGWITLAARKPNLFFSAHVELCIREADIILIAVNTPTKSKGAGAGRATDMTAFEAVTSEVAQYARPGTIIVEKSTVPCGTADLVQRTMAVHRPNVHFEILSNPEFLAAGTAMKDLMHPDRVLIGSSMTPEGERAAETLANIYAAWVPRSRIITTNVYSSELAKLGANSMLAQRISSMNSLSAICEKAGANVDEIAASIGCDPRIGDKFLKAGIGFGGSCFKKDILSLVYLAESLGEDEVGEYWRQVVKMNEYQRNRFTRRVIKCLNNTLVGKKVTILGYAFKANTSDTRESPALEIIKTLLEESPREIAIFDPCCNPVVVRAEIKELITSQPALQEDGGPIEVYSSPYTACDASHAILITTECDEFRTVPGENSGETLSRPEVILPVANEADPRPFLYSTEPTETQILALQRFMLSSASAALDSDSDPLSRFEPEPACEHGCPDCGLIKTSGYSTAGNSSENRSKDRLNWRRIACNMSKPKWVFDGKGIIDAEQLKIEGVRVESIGR
ncbi:nucleotide sugar dehydrogenase [Hypoxylon sp. FL0890]|nr:nucleotide sugar dehydrogenase [Hypoxylon sp. FL0890]